MLAAVTSINTMHRMLICSVSSEALDLMAGWSDCRPWDASSNDWTALIPARTKKNLSELMTRRNRHLMGSAGCGKREPGLQGGRSSQEAAGVERHHVRIGLRYSLPVARVDV